MILEKESIITNTNESRLTETLPFQNYRTVDNSISLLPLQNKTYSNTKRPSDNDDEHEDENGHDGDVDEDDEEDREKAKRKLIEQKFMQPSTQPDLMNSSFSRNLSSVKPTKNSTMLMMMKTNGDTKTILGENQTQSSFRRYNFIPTRLHGTRFIAKSTDQLHRSFVHDNNHVNYSMQTPIPSFQSTSKKTKSSGISIMKQSFIPRFVPIKTVQSTSKIMYPLTMVRMLFLPMLDYFFARYLYIYIHIIFIIINIIF